jgi:hypothetical protein
MAGEGGGWTNADIEETWKTVARSVRYAPDDGDAMGVTYGGPDDDRPWTAWLTREVPGGSPGFAPEGWGNTPMAALLALAEAVEHGFGYWEFGKEAQDHSSADP